VLKVDPGRGSYTSSSCVIARQDGGGQSAPCTLRLVEERIERCRRGGQLICSRAELPEGRLELDPPTGVVDVRGETRDCAIVERELTAEIAAGGQDEERSPHRPCELVCIETDLVERDEGEHRGRRVGRRLAEGRL
jgi:hypothetical protein